jgi:hypothetical protein
MNSLNDLECRTKRLEILLLPGKDYRGDVYDFLFMAEQTIEGPPGSSPEDEALRRLGSRDDFVNDFRQD